MAEGPIVGFDFKNPGRLPRGVRSLLVVWFVVPVSVCMTVVTRSEQTVLVREGEPKERVSAPSLDGKGASDWAARLLSEKRLVRRRAQERLLGAGTEGVPMLVALLQWPEDSVRDRAEETLTRLGAPALPSVVKLARAFDPDTRRRTAGILRDLGADAAEAVRTLEVLLFDGSPGVAMEAARALALMGRPAAPTIPSLGATLSHSHYMVRVMAAGALASIGSASGGDAFAGAASVPALQALAVALHDEQPTVRRAAADAVAAIGPAAALACVDLMVALKDENLFVRISAAGALGSIGRPAESAVSALRALRGVPGMQAAVTWALARITGEEAVATAASPAPPLRAKAESGSAPHAWALHCGNASRNAVAHTTGLPRSWDVGTKRNILWSATLGDTTYCGPIVAGGKVFIGTGSQEGKRLRLGSGASGSHGTLAVLRARDGQLLWFDNAHVLPANLGNFLIHQTTSSPLVEGERLYYMTAQGQLRCLDTEGFLDGENDGPLQDEPRTAGVDADHIWELELATELGVFPHEATNCSVVSAGNLLMVCTSNGVDEAHVNHPAPHAPSFIGVDKSTGGVAWRVVGPSPRVVHGQWSSPSLVSVGNRVLACFGGGDGLLYALEPSTGREVWRYDGNPPEAVWRTGGDIRGKVLRNNIIASPLVYDGTIFLAMGQDPEHGQGQGRLHAIDPSGTGDVTRNRRLWESTEVGRTIATPIAHAGLLYVADYNGRVHCLEAETGKRLWEHDVLAGIWGTFLLADGKLYVGDEDGQVIVLGLGRDKKVLAEIDMEEPLWGAPCAVDGVLYLSTSRRVFAIAEPAAKSAASSSGER